MYEYIDKYNLLAEQQYGFCKQHSTEYAAVKLVDRVSKEMEIGKTSTNVYIDLSKAFDNNNNNNNIYLKSNIQSI